MKKITRIEINKTDAARRQIDTAINLLFDNKDIVSIHTLTLASFRILKDLVSKETDNEINQFMKAVFKPGMEKVYWDKFFKFSNFLKHADRDPDETHEIIKEELNDMALLKCILYYNSLGLELTIEMRLFITWFGISNPNLLELPFDKIMDCSALPHDNEYYISSIKNSPRSEQLKTFSGALKHIRKQDIMGGISVS